MRRVFRYLWRFLLIGIGLAILYPKLRTYGEELPDIFREANVALLVALVATSILSYIIDAWLSQLLLRAAGTRSTVRDNFTAAILGVVGAQMVPMIGGTVATYYFYRTRNLASGVIVFVTTTWTLLVWAATYAFFAVSLFFLPREFLALMPPHFSGIAAAVLALLTVLAFLLFRRKGQGLYRIARIGATITSALLRRVRGNGIDRSASDGAIGDLYRSLDLLWAQKKRVPVLLAVASLYYLSNIAALAISFRMFGYHDIHPALIIFGYTLSSLLAIFTLVPANPGVMEVSLGVIFSALGVPPHIAVVATLAYRIFSYWLWLPLGAVIFFRLKHREAPAS